MLYLDLDGVKTVNDRHGHHAGDELLVEVAAGCAHEPQSITARIGIADAHRTATGS